MASHLERTAGIKGVKAGLLREFVSKEDFANPESLAYSIKHLQIPLVAPRPLDEAQHGFAQLAEARCGEGGIAARLFIEKNGPKHCLQVAAHA